jgi:putative endonuclease
VTRAGRSAAGDRAKRHRRGQWAESLCVWRLRLAGWRILSRRFVTGRGSGAGEVDIVARRGKVVAMIEVKARGDLAAAAESIGARQQRRITRGAEAFLARHPHLGALQIRFDAMLVLPWRMPRHIPDAWRRES